MDLEEIINLISAAAGRLARVAAMPERNEKWWGMIAKEDWNLIKLSWELRGVILRRGKETEVGLTLNEEISKQIENIVEKAEGEEA